MEKDPELHEVSTKAGSQSESRTNRLIREKSPYLLQHAYNPVDWYAWGDEAFEKARKEDKPIFLSIGYSTCHWCHVMEHESFEDTEVARLMNEAFVSIKVDREERPDLDHVYMTVCQMMTGAGGWPLNVILTPDRKPFFAGTYFPKESRFGRLGMMDLAPRIEELWRTQREQVCSRQAKSCWRFARCRTHLPVKCRGKMSLTQPISSWLNALTRCKADSVRPRNSRLPITCCFFFDTGSELEKPRHWRWSRRHCRPCAWAGSTIMLDLASTVTRPMPSGLSLILKRCSTIRQCWLWPILRLIKQRENPSMRKLHRKSSRMFCAT